MDPVWLALAFVFGFGVRQIGLPPLVGYLAAGFILHAANIEGGEVLTAVADFGVLLLLFTIGLKLNIRSLLRPPIWAGATLHMLVTITLFGSGLVALTVAGVGPFADLDLKTTVLLGFALSFSSTVFAVKVLEERGEMASQHGQIAIGILIMQDIFAVVFLTASKGTLPSTWALALLALPLARPLLIWIMTRSGHGELLVLFGLLAMMGAFVLVRRLEAQHQPLAEGPMAAAPVAGLETNREPPV